MIKRFDLMVENPDFFARREKGSDTKIGEGIVFSDETVIINLYKPIGTQEFKVKSVMSFYRSFADFKEVMLEGRMIKVEWLDYPGNIPEERKQ